MLRSESAAEEPLRQAARADQGDEHFVQPEGRRLRQAGARGGGLGRRCDAEYIFDLSGRLNPAQEPAQRAIPPAQGVARKGEEPKPLALEKGGAPQRRGNHATGAKHGVGPVGAEHGAAGTTGPGTAAVDLQIEGRTALPGPQDAQQTQGLRPEIEDAKCS